MLSASSLVVLWSILRQAHPAYATVQPSVPPSPTSITGYAPEEISWFWVGSGPLWIWVIVGIPTIIGTWKGYAKAGRRSWAALIPIYSNVVWLEVAGQPWVWILVALLALVPVLGWIGLLVVDVYLSVLMAQACGKRGIYGFGLALLPFVFYPMLGFGPSRYHGPAGGQPVPPPGHPPAGLLPGFEGPRG
ncbi:MAG: DUF5684 domain-containing protein [Actinomycetota bacterium]